MKYPIGILIDDSAVQLSGLDQSHIFRNHFVEVVCENICGVTKEEGMK